MALSEIEKKRCEKIVGAYIEKYRPPAHIRPELDIGFRVKEQSVEIFEIRPVWRNPKEKMENPVVKATYVKIHNLWKVYWQRANMEWYPYEPAEVSRLEDFLELVEHDRYGCFWG